MSRAAFSLLVFAVYISILGTVLLLAPNALLSVLGFEPTSEVWIRVVGMLLVIIAFVDWNAARTGLVDYIRWTVPARAMVIVFATAFVVAGWTKPQLLIFGVIDLAAAIWTAVGLRADAATG